MGPVIAGLGAATGSQPEYAPPLFLARARAASSAQIC